MPRARFTIPAMMLAVALLAAGCAGDDAAEQPEDGRADGVSEVATSDRDQPDTSVRESAEQTEQPDAGAEPEPEPAAGARCGTVTGLSGALTFSVTWDWLAEIQGQVDRRGGMVLRDAEEALEAADRRVG